MLLTSENCKNVKRKNFECLGSNVSVYFKVIDKSLTALKFAIFLCNFDGEFYFGKVGNRNCHGFFTPGAS